MANNLQVELPDEWNLLESSTSKLDPAISGEILINPSDWKPPASIGYTTSPYQQMTFDYEVQDASYDPVLTMNLQIFSSATNAPFDAGTAIAVAPSLPATFASGITTWINGVEVENIPSFLGVINAQRQIRNTSKSWYDATQGELDGFLLPAPGQYDYSAGSTGIANYQTAVIGATGASVAVYNQNNGENFWKLQALTDNGKVWNVKIPLKQISQFWQSVDKPQVNSKVKIQFSIPQTQYKTHLLRNSSVADGYLYCTSAVLIGKTMTPPAQYLEPLKKLLDSGRSTSLLYPSVYTCSIPQFSSGTTLLTQNISLKIGHPIDYIVISFLRSNASQDQTKSTYASIAPTPNSYGNPIQTASLKIGQILIPQNIYGPSSNNDVMREYSAVQKWIHREDPEYQGAVIRMNDWLNSGSFYLVFDFSRIPFSQIKSSETATLSIQFANAFSDNIDPFATVYGSDPGELTLRNGKTMFNIKNT